MNIKKIGLALLLLSTLSPPVSANESWKDVGFQMKLVNTLDRDDGYCIDVVGAGNYIKFDMSLIAHNCKEGLSADEAVTYRSDGTIFFPAYNRCVTVMGLNNHALPYSALMIKKCNVDESFLKSTKFQKFTINKHKQVQLNATNLCITVGDSSKETYSPDHRWRSFYMQDCSASEPELSQWNFVKPKI